MEALVANRGVLSRALNIVTSKSIGQGCQVKRIPLPKISEQEILVKVHAAALNPIDYKSIDLLAPRESVIGCDYAGQVVEVGKNAAGNWKVGDRVAGFVHGGHYSDRGSFCSHLKIDGDLAWRIPEGLSDEEASTYGLAAATAMLALNTHLGLASLDTSSAPRPQETKSRGTILIYAGSTSVGLFAIQLAKKSGYTVVTTASPRSFDLVKQYGADMPFDYRSPTAVEDIAKAFPAITQAFDCISEGRSTEFCAQVIKKNGGKVVTLFDQGKSKTPGVKYDFIVVFTVFGQKFAWLPPIGPMFPAVPADRAALVRFYSNLPNHVNDIKPTPLRVVGSGFKEILSGLGDLRQGKVSGQKLVVKFKE
ncbi:probable ToxD-like zinc binding oxidoreductase [Phialocephala subalpina]|uniref:Probable ToxD-like zinc binding oxidoreductase n=1 Tax=Phialocephala subalpina TaxID=576137 RepID=A0A1L7XTI7_9HELO|nr:probable ToxD-like zinc binding oxidoreductase [Phialocephala subalpina]